MTVVGIVYLDMLMVEHVREEISASHLQAQLHKARAQGAVYPTISLTLAVCSNTVMVVIAFAS
jgi:hypothetical protein